MSWLAWRKRILNPDIWTIFGDVFAKLQGLFRLETEYVVMGVEGTEFFITAGRNNQVSVIVLDGVVRLESKTQRWGPISLGKFEGGTVQGQEAPQRKPVAQKRVNAIIQWTNQVERLTRSDSKMLMPNVIGVREEEARRILDGEQLIIRSVEARLTQQSPVGTVVEQSPPAGTRVPRGGPVILRVEAEPAQVPSLVRQGIEQARQLIQQRRLSPGTVDQQVTGRAQPGTVISQNPPPGTWVPVGSSVDLVVEAESVVVPRIVGQHVEQARRMLLSERLSLGGVRQELTGKAAAGTVLRQNPGPGTPVRPGTAVELVIEVVPPKPPVPCEVPRVLRLTLEQAKSTLERAGFKVGISGRGTLVANQDPRPGSRIACGGTVTLEIVWPPK